LNGAFVCVAGGNDLAKKSSNVTKYKKPLPRPNIGMIIFGVVFFYVIVCVILYFQSSRIVRYEVQEGSLTTSNLYRGIALRDETVIYTETAGHIDYYAREGERVAKNDLVYIVDETGALSERLAAMNTDENSLSDRELAEFRNEIVNFSHSFDRTSFSSTYDFKYSLKNTVLKLAGAGLLQNIDDFSDGAGNIIYSYAPTTGLVAYWTDGYEELSADGVTESVFEDEYEKKQLQGGELVAVGSPAYKLSTNENWSLVIPMEAERAAQLQEEGYVKVRFIKNQYESWGAAKMVAGSDGNTYLQLSFTNSMVTFLNDRFLEIELILEEEKGLKIPVSSIVQKEFYLIPERFVIPGTTGGGSSILRQCYLEDGTISSQWLEIEVYNYDSEEKEYYLDSTFLKAGDVLCKEDGQETFTVSKKATLTGVYNMNKGYADFKQIHILYQNDEYAIVKSNTAYGLNVYDYIVLDAASVSDDQFINQ